MSLEGDLEWPAALFLPAGGRDPGAVVPAGSRWRLDPQVLRHTSGTVVWGRLPLPAGTGTRRVLDTALRREIALWRVRHDPARRHHAAGVYRLPAPTMAAGGVRGWARRALRGGTLVEFAAPNAGPRLLDVIAHVAGANLPVTAIRLGSGGAALARVSLRDGTDALLRMAPAGSPGDPSAAATWLQALAAIPVDMAPRLRGLGEVGGIAWTVESLVPGRRPRRVTPACAHDVAALCASLPKAAGAPTAPTEDLTTLASILDDRAPALHRLIDELERSLGTVCAVMRHGDLWAGNLLMSGGRLSGVVDWDAAHLKAMPGADLLQLVASEHRRRNRLELGEVWLQRPWRWPAFVGVTESYWPAVGLRMTDELIDLLAIAWWATETAGTLRRFPYRATDDRWLTANIEPVLATLS
jgi:hypothetical protein